MTQIPQEEVDKPKLSHPIVQKVIDYIRQKRIVMIRYNWDVMFKRPDNNGWVWIDPDIIFCTEEELDIARIFHIMLWLNIIKRSEKEDFEYSKDNYGYTIYPVSLRGLWKLYQNDVNYE